MEFHVGFGCTELKGLNGEIADKKRCGRSVSNISAITPITKDPCKLVEIERLELKRPGESVTHGQRAESG
jgi:hypothetical protein